MAGLSWLAGGLAAVMILSAGYAASRLAASRTRGVVTEADTDGLHALMGTAMAGMLLPQLSLLPSGYWAAVFGVGAAWFAVSAIRSRKRMPSRWQCRFPVPHLVECIAMLYMLLSMPARHGPGMAMPAMGIPADTSAAFPAFAVILALFMLGYLVWTTDHLASLVRAKPTPGPPRAQQRALVPLPTTGRLTSLASPIGTPATAGSPHTMAGQSLLAPRLAACSKMVMTITMGYMLITML